MRPSRNHLATAPIFVLLASLSVPGVAQDRHSYLDKRHFFMWVDTTKTVT